MEEALYDSETLLQKLLADHPDLLAGDQIDAEEPRRWLLVSREMAVPGEQDGAGHWSLDHLFLDQDAIPTLVEVKRSPDTRIRPEVIGRMLDYAANAVAYWHVEEVKGHGFRIWWGQGRKDGSFFPMYDNSFGKNFLFSVWTYGAVELQSRPSRETWPTCRPSPTAAST